MKTNPKLDTEEPVDLDEAVTIVLQLAESKWIHRAWRRHKLTPKQISAVARVSQMVEHGSFARQFPTSSEELLRAAGYVLQEAVEKLLALPEQHPAATEDELEDAVANGFAPEIREHSGSVLLARNALRITRSLLNE